MNKLSASDRQKVTDALTECARSTKDIENTSELANAAYDILAKKLGDNPGLFKAACQVYNSCKSIHKLSSADDAHRGDSFAILNVREMTDRLTKDKYNSIRKAASAPVRFGRISSAPVMAKVASASDRKVEKPEVKMSDSDFKLYIRQEIEDMEDFIHKTASALRIAKLQRSEAFERFVSAFALEPAAVRKEAAARLYSNYGSDADKLIKEFGEARPLSKVASSDYVSKYRGTPSIPDTAVYTCAKRVFDADRNLAKMASAFDAAGDLVVTTVRHITDGYSKLLRKSAATAAGTVGALTTANILSYALGLGESPEEAKLKKDIYNAEYTNNLIAHSYQRAFVRAAINKAISKYSLSSIIDAFNRAVAKLPIQTRSVPATANQQLIEGMMIDELAKGSVPSKADTEIISNLTTAFGKINQDREGR